jgi:putative hydrolase of the HAD superfamily
MNHIKAVIFDLDNTLLDRTLTFRSFSSSFLSHYFSHLDVTQHLLDLIIEIDQDGYKDKEELFAQLLELSYWQDKPQLSELMAYYSREYVRSAVLMNGAREVVQYVRTKYKVGVITNGKTPIQYGKMDQLGIRNDFDLIIVSEEVGIKKPDRRIFEMALDKLELKPEQCIYIGDHPVNDIEGAAKAGMETIWMKVNQPWRNGIKAQPLHQIEELSSLFELI